LKDISDLVIRIGNRVFIKVIFFPVVNGKDWNLERDVYWGLFAGWQEFNWKLWQGKKFRFLEVSECKHCLLISFYSLWIGMKEMEKVGFSGSYSHGLCNHSRRCCALV